MRTDITTEQWAVEYLKDRYDSAEDQIRIIDASPTQQNHPQGPLVIATMNARANAPHVEHTLAAAAAMAASPQVISALEETCAALANWARLIDAKEKQTQVEQTIAYNAALLLSSNTKALRAATGYDVNDFQLV